MWPLVSALTCTHFALCAPRLLLFLFLRAFAPVPPFVRPSFEYYGDLALVRDHWDGLTAYMDGQKRLTPTYAPVLADRAHARARARRRCS